LSKIIQGTNDVGFERRINALCILPFEEDSLDGPKRFSLPLKVIHFARERMGDSDSRIWWKKIHIFVENKHYKI